MGLLKRGQRVVALGLMQLVALAGIVGLAVILGAVLVSNAKTKGWLDGLVIGAVSVALTVLVLLSGRHVRRRA
jgi:Na+/proline symporter